MPRIFSRVKKGNAIGAQVGLAASLNKMFDILENIEGLGGVEIAKDGIDWRVKFGNSLIGSGGGYTGTLTVVTGRETTTSGTTDLYKLKTQELTFVNGLVTDVGTESSTTWFSSTPHSAEPAP